ncbi:MAG: 50S ribosomal protein L18 [Gemmatimonadota bacterium]
MRRIVIPRTRAEQRKRRHIRLRVHLTGTAERPRLVVHRSLKHIYAQLVDDVGQRTLMTVGDKGTEGRKSERASAVGKKLAEQAKAAGIGSVVFDRAGYRYHCRVNALADGAREGGLEF